MAVLWVLTVGLWCGEASVDSADWSVPNGSVHHPPPETRVDSAVDSVKWAGNGGLKRFLSRGLDITAGLLVRMRSFSKTK